MAALIAAGLGLGLLGSAAVARLITRLLYHVSAMDPWMFVGVLLYFYPQWLSWRATFPRDVLLEWIRSQPCDTNSSWRFKSVTTAHEN